MILESRSGNAALDAALIMRTGSPYWKPPYWKLTLIALVALSCAGQFSAAEEASPRIEACRVGFDGWFKVGHWTPIWVTILGALGDEQIAVEVTTADSDGVDVTVSAPAVSTGTTLLYTRVGRLRGELQVKLVTDEGRVLDRVHFSPDRAGDGRKLIPLPSTGELILELGPASLGVAVALGSIDAAEGPLARGVVRIAEVELLPTEWYGYNGVNVLVLPTSDAKFCERLAADERRLDALRKWLELGGRLVICAGHTAPDLFAAGQPFADFAPGKVEPLVRLLQTQALENYAGSGDAIGRSGLQQNIPVPLLTDVRGRVELLGGGNDLPLVVRAAHGLGEVTFVAVDLAEPPLAEWNGRPAFLRAVLGPYLAETDNGRGKHKLVSLGYDDLAGALRQRLGRTFVGVTAIGISIVAALVIGYLVLLGPLNFFFVDRLLRRPLVAWITLPAIVLGTAVGAMLLSGAAKKTDGLRTHRLQINTAELVDVDLTTRRTRGNSWVTLFSPQAERFDLTLAPQEPDGRPVQSAQSLVTWFGLPGSGLGGMHAAGESIDVTGVGYRTSANLNELVGLPVLTSSTKSLQATWDSVRPSDTQPPLAAELTLNDDGLLVGSLTNQSGVPLRNAYLLSGQWGYLLGEFRPGQRIEVGPERNLIRVRTILARRAGQDVAADRSTFLADRATIPELLTVMMFYVAAGGEGFAGLPNRYQSHCDLSRLLELDRAILVATSPNRGSQWSDAATGKSLEGEQDSATIVYRFIFPLSSVPSTLHPQP